MPSDREVDEALAAAARLPVGSKQRAAGLADVGLALLGSGDVRRAVDVLAQADAAFEASRDTTPNRAITADALGRARRLTGDPEGAMGPFFIAYQLWARSGDLERAALSAHSMAEAGHAAGSDLQVIQVLEKAAAELRADGLTAQASIGRREALALRLEAGLRTRGAAVAFEDEANALQQEGAFELGAEMRRRALEIFEELDPSSEDTAVCLTNLAIVEMALGQLAHARSRLIRAVKVLEALPPPTPRLDSVGQPSRNVRIAWVFGSLARIAVREQNRDTAEMWARRGLRALDDEPHETYDRASLLSELGSVLLSDGRAAEAVAPLSESLRIFERIRLDGQDVVNVMNALALAHMRSGDLAAASRLVAQARERAMRHATDPRVRSDALLGVGLVQLQGGNLGDAETSVLEAIAAVKQAGITTPDLAGPLNALGHIRLQRDDLDGALAAFDEAIPLIESVRDRAAVPGDQANVFGDLLAPYGGAIDALFRRGRAGDEHAAFEYAERSRATDLAALIGYRDVRLTPQTQEQATMLMRERELERRLATLVAQSAVNRADPKAAVQAAMASGDFAKAINDEIQDWRSRPMLEEELAATRSEIWAAFPDLSKRTRPHPATLVEAQADLPPGGLLIEYVINGDAIRIWAATSTDVVAVTSPLPTSAVLKTLARLVLHFSERGKPPPNRDPAVVLSESDLETVASELGRALLGPIPWKMVESATSIRIVPDGPLQYLPFELLRHPAAAEESSGDSVAIAYAPSATVLHQLGRDVAGAGWDREFIGYGDVPAPSPGSMAARAAAARREVLGPLPHTKREVDTIARLFPGSSATRLGTDATERSVRQETGGVRFVHFATHGLVDDFDSLYGGILVAPPLPAPTTDGDAQKAPASAEAQPIDDLLQTFELFDLRLSADLVVLSACRTGRGKLQDGEGIRGMAHALFAAGARCVILSLWSVPDRASADLMIGFYSNLQTGATIARALAMAKADLRKTPGWGDPFYWAGFVAIGPADQLPS
jgi:CHAT domain-containing protein/tetratricopeptide (TPR) repeat protein